MHLNNILNQLQASEDEKRQARDFFKDKTVSFAAVEHFLDTLRK